MVNERKNLIIIPTYNERKNINVIVDEIYNVLPRTRILVVDDSSPDGTSEEVKKMMSCNEKIRLLIRKEKIGLGDAYLEALSYVRENYGDIETIMTMDADGSHDTIYLKNMLLEMDKFDLVIGSRYIHGDGVKDWEFWRILLSKLGNFYSRIMTGLTVKDLTAGFVCFKKELIEKINLKNISSSGYAYQIEFKYACSRVPKAKIKEIPIVFKSRREGESKISNQIIKEGLKTPFKIFWFFSEKVQ